ncbi:MAG: hypothetical protein Q9227_001906 [Pyrenula ochraceoflavens]
MVLLLTLGDADDDADEHSHSHSSAKLLPSSTSSTSTHFNYKSSITQRNDDGGGRARRHHHHQEEIGSVAHGQFEEERRGGEGEDFGGMDWKTRLFATALGCYPIISSLTRSLDLNTLHCLALTCHSFRRALLPFRRQLITQTLRCENDEPVEVREHTFDNPPSRHPSPLPTPSTDKSSATTRQQQQQQHPPRSPAAPGHRHQRINPSDIKIPEITKLSSGRIGPCARDLVGPCRRCGLVVCRNCTAKPPSARFLKERVRRLCQGCIGVPLRWHTDPTITSAAVATRPGSSDSGSSGTLDSDGCSGEVLLAEGEEEDEAIRGGKRGNEGDGGDAEAFTSVAFSREPCICEETVWLCQDCGMALHSQDVTYRRVWTWRSRYSTHIGGLGTGMGEGNQGQKCGRGQECLAAKVIEVEIDCSSDEGKSAMGGHDRDVEDEEGIVGAALGNQVANGRDKAGYWRQEVEGIGGIVKKKVKKRVRVGATVTEFEDERETGKYLQRETTGALRSCCGWCARIVPGEDDLKKSRV